MTGSTLLRVLRSIGAVVLLAIAVLAAILPFLQVSSYVRTLVYYTAYYLALGQAWNLMSGLTGYVSFAHGALAGIGAYAAVIYLNMGVPLPLALAGAALTTIAASLVIGATSLRLRGTAFTFATLFFQELVLLLVRKLPFAGGPGGLVLQDIYPIWVPHVLMVVIAVLSTILVMGFQRTRTGLRIRAMRDDQPAADAVGIDATRLKLALFALSSAVAGLVGAVHGIFASSIYPNEVFSVDISIVALAVPLIGGAGTGLGPVMGAVLYVALREALQILAPNLHLAIVGLVLLLVVLLLRDGIVPAVLRWTGFSGASRGAVR